MAAKQGLSAQISQASEDAKRAVLSRTALTNSLWFSNLNTTCTIKSAPPRNPDVLGLLSTKSGWLFKRNEQHVWQARYCCVVPHTFLYYFDAHPSNPCQTPSLTPKQQEQLNKAVRQGYGKRGALKQQQPRSSLYAVLGAQNPPAVEGDTADSQSAVQPAGIIDLECYTTVHRNSQNELLMELAGDETVNPDLRSFYFCANNEDDGEEWSHALLANRHSSLVDEKDAYQQVCDGFAQQLQVLHSDLETAEAQAEAKQEEVYRVRSQMEDARRSCLRLVQDTLERADGTVPAKRAYRTDLETIQAQDLGILPAVQLLCDYTRVLEETCRDSTSTVEKLENQMQTKQEGDSSRVKELEDEIAKLRAEMQQQKDNAISQTETIAQKLIQAQKESQDVQKDLASQRMELTMYQSSTRTKIGELQSHKKILKKEVIELRKKLEEAYSQLDLFKHKETSVKMEAAQERQKAKLLERYVEKMESQVKVQQNMMEMMSAAGSQYGGSIYGPDGGDFHAMDVQVPSSGSVSKGFAPGGRREYGNIIVNTPSSVRPEGEDDDEEEEEEEEHQVPVTSGKRSSRRAIDDDAKSHMSELTEDRTQRHFDAAYYIHQQQQKENAQRRAMGASPRNMQHHALMGAPPSIIIGGVSEERSEKSSASAPKLDTIMSTRSSTRPRTDGSRYNESVPPKPQTPKKDSDSVSLSSKLSVAQRARIEADRQSTPNRVRVSASSTTPVRGARTGETRNQKTSSDNSVSGGSFLQSLGRRIENALDNSILGVDDTGSYSSYVSTDVGTDIGTDVNTDVGTDDESYKPRRSSRHHQEEKKTSDTASVASSGNVSISLAERQALQRAQQMKFLKEQGLLRENADMDGTTSVASIGSFRRRVDGKQ